MFNIGGQGDLKAVEEETCVPLVDDVSRCCVGNVCTLSTMLRRAICIVDLCEWIDLHWRMSLVSLDASIKDSVDRRLDVYGSEGEIPTKPVM